MDFRFCLRKWTLLERNCYEWTYNSDRIQKNASGNGILERKKRVVTMPKRNADFRANPKGLCIFIKSLNLMDLALDKKKKKQNQKL